MGPTGRLVTIKRSGVDGPHFPLSLSTCLFGRGIECDIRIQLPVVSKQHCKIEISGQKATLFNFSATNPTQVNGSVIDEPVQLKHGDMITIVDRSFRYENESQTTEFPGQRREQVSPHQGTRSDFSSDPDGNVQDPNARSEVTEEGVSGPVGVGAAHGIPRASGEPGARKTPDVPSSALTGDDGKNAAGPTAGEFREDSSVTSVSGSGELTRPSTRCLEKCGENESPFRKLYESLKEELDVKSEKENVLQNRRRSGSRSHHTTDNGSAGGSQGAAQLRVSPKPGRRSGPRSQSEAGSASGDRGRGRTEARRTDAGPAQTPRDAVGPRVAPRELTKSESPAPCLQQNSSRPGPGGDRSRGGDSVSLGPQVSLGAGGGLSAPERILTRTQTQTATRDDGADKSRNTPEKALSKKRRSSVPVNTDMLAVDTDTQAPAPLSPLRAQAERKVPDGPLSTPEPLDVSNSAEDVNKMEGVPSKRRRVSFGGHLRPELFDENLPPNTPLKRGETPTKRRSLGTHTPAVLKKIIKEQPLPSGKDDTSEIRLGTPAQNALPSLPARTPTAPAAAHTHGARPLPSGPPCAQGTDLPRSGGRRSSGRPPRPSVGRSQLELLQAIHSKRRSGASEANLIVAKSWADVVRLSAKQAQTKVAKRSAQRPPSKRQRRSNTPKKPVGSVHHLSSTGHANSPCTIVIGKAHLEKVNAPARPCRMLNSFIFSRKADFNEDLSGLTEMFKTPAKEKVQMTSICPTTFSNSEDLLRKMFAVPSSEEETLLCTAKNSGETVSPSTRNAPEEPSEKSSINPAFRRQRLIVTGEMGRAPPEAEPLRPASSAHKLRRSAELGNARTPGAEGEHGVTEASAVEDTWGGRLGRMPSREQKPEGELKESARSFETCRKSNRSEENSEKAAAARRSRALELRRVLRPEDPVALGRPHDTDPAGAWGSHGPLRSPAHPKEPGVTESRTTTVGSQPPEPEPFRTPAQGNMQVKTPSQKVSVEVLSAQRKCPHTPGKSTNTPREPEGDEKDVTACEDTPEQKRNPAEHAPGSRRRPRTPKRKVQALEDLASFTELLQTPDPTLEPVTDDKTNNIPCRSPQVDPVITSTVMTRGLKTLLQKVDVEEALLALRKSPRAPGKTTCSPREPAGDEKVIEFFQATPEQKLDPAENAAGSRRRPRTPKRKVQALEDLAGFTELLQTPDPTLEPVTDDKTNNIPCRSPQVDPVITSTVMTRGLKTLLQKVDVEEALLALKKSPRAPGKTTCSPREPAGDEKVIEFFQATPELKPDPAENAAGSRRRPRTPKRKVQHLEDLAGFRELFQTPKPLVEPVTDVKTKIPCKSPQAEPVITSTVMTGWLKTPPCKVDVDVEEALSALRKSPRIPRGTTCSPREPADDEKITKAFKATPEQKLELTENAARSKRRPRTPKRKVQSLGDLAGFRELFQSPDRTLEPVTDVKTKTPCKSPQAEPVTMPTGRKSRLKTSLGKVEMDEDISALRNPTPTPGETTHSHGEAGSDDKDINNLKQTPEQKVDPAENAAGSKRRPRTPKRKEQPLEELAGFTELLQTPDRTLEPVTYDKTQIPCRSPQVDPVITSTIVTKGLKTLLQKVDVEEALLALRKSPRAPGGTTCSPREPAGDEKVIEFFQATPELKPDPAENAAGSRRIPRTPKRKVQHLEDLAGFRELFQSPDRTLEPVTDVKTKTPCKSPQAEPVTTSTGRKSRLKTSLGKVDVEEDISALKNPKPTPGETTRSHGEAGSEDKDISHLKQTPEQKVDPVENAAGSKRRPRTPKRKEQPLEELAGFTELLQTPDRTLEPVTDDKTNNIPSRSPKPEPINTNRKSHLKTPLEKVDIEEELSAPRKPTPTPGGTTHLPREPGDDKEIKVFKATPEQKLDPAENAARSKRRPRTPKRKVQSLGDLTGFTELLQTPDRTLEPVTDDKTQIPCRSPQVDPVITSTIVTKGLKTLLQKVDVEEALLALRKSPRAPGKTTCSPREPAGDEKVIEFFQATPEQKLDPAENAAGSRRRPRTPKRKVQHLEDLAGFRELFQTPDRTLEPVTDVKTKTPCKSPQAEPVTMSTGRKSRLKTSLGKVDVEEDISALRNPTPTPGETTHSHREAGGDDKDISHLKQTPEQKVDPAENAARSKRRPRTPKRRVQHLEDLAGFRELFQTPKPLVEPVTDVKTKIPCKSPQAEPVITSTVMTGWLKTPPCKVDVDVEEALSALRKSPRIPRGTTCSPREPADDEKITKAFKATPEQKLELTENVTGSRRRPRTPKRKAQALEELAGFRELLQTPDRTVDAMTEVKTRTPCKSPQAEPVTMPTGRKSHLKTSLGKVEMDEDISALRNPTPTPGETTHSHGEAGGDDKDISHLKQTPEQKVDPAENAAGSKRRPRTPKRREQPLELLAGFRELLQTPDRTLEPVTDDKTQTPCRSPQAEPVTMSTGRKSRLKTSLGKVDVEEDISALRNPTPTPGETTHSHREAGGDDKDISHLKQTPEQKVDPVENAAGSKRRPRTPKRRVQSLGDLTGFRELFQSPDRTVASMTDDKSNNIPSTSPKPEPINTNRKSHLKTPLEKVDIEEELSAPRKPTPTPGGPSDDKEIKVFKATPEQKLDPAENAARSKRRPRTPKRKEQPLEELAGFTELLQTSDCTLEPVTYDKTQIPCRSPQVDPVITSTIVTKGLKTLLQKVDVEEALLALRKSPRAPGKTICSPREPAGDEKVIEFFQATPEQKLDPAENAAGSRRRPRTPKRKVQHLEDLAGFRELFQTPDRTLEPVTDVKTKTPCKSPQAEPVTMSTGRKSRLKTSLGKVDVEEDISALRNPTPTPGETTRSHREAGGDDKDISHLKQTPEQKVDPAENAAGSKRRPRTPKRRVQSLGDLTGFRELFQSPDRTLEPVTDVKTKIPCRSPQAEPLITSTVMTRGLKTLLQKVDVEEALSALGKSPRAPGGTTYSPREPAGDEKITKAFKATPEQKLELTENVTGSRRRPRTPKGKAQALEDLAGIEELFRTPDHTVEPVTDDKTKILCRSPRGEPINTSTSRKSHLKTPLEKVDIEEEPLAPRKPTPTPGGTTHLPREPGDDKDIRAFKATPEQKLELTEIVIGSKRKPRTPKGKAQALEDLAGIEELFRTPDRTVAPVTDDKAQIPCKSPQAEPAGRKKRLKAPPGKVDIEVEPSALKKPTRTSRKTTSSHREPKGDDEDIKLFKKTSEQKADSAENVTRSKRRPRAPKEMARAVGDLAGLVEPFQTSDHTDGPGTDDRAAKTLRQSSRPELGIRAASKKRQGKAPTREEDVEEEEEPAAPRKSTRTSGKTTRSHSAAVGGNKKASVSQETVAQSLGPAGNAEGSRRRLRTRTEQPPPPEDRPGCQELIAAPGQDEAPGSDAESARRDPAPTRDKRKPAKTSRRVPRALSVEPTEGPARSPNGSVSRSPTRERGKDENLAGAKRLRTRTCPQDAAEDPPLQKRQRTAPRDRRPPPGPAVTDRRSQRLLAERTDLPSSTVSVKNKRQKAEVMAPPEKGTSLRSRRPNKTSGVEQGPGFTSAEKAPTRRNVKKTPNTSQEMKLRNLEDGAEDPAPGGQAQGGGARLRPGRQRRVPAGAAGEAGDSRAGIHGDAREEKEGAKRSGRGCLRPRKVAAPTAGDTLENEPKQRVTRSAKRSAESLTKENDNVCVRKMRTRSHRDNEDI